MAEHSGVTRWLLVPLYSVRVYESDVQAAFTAALKSLLMAGSVVRSAVSQRVDARGADAFLSKSLGNLRFCLDVCCSVGAELYFKTV